MLNKSQILEDLRISQFLIKPKCNVSNSSMKEKDQNNSTQSEGDFSRTIMIKVKLTEVTTKSNERKGPYRVCCYLDPGDHVGEVAEAGHPGVQLGLRERRGAWFRRGGRE
jgi:hypothetical protein